MYLSVVVLIANIFFSEVSSVQGTYNINKATSYKRNTVELVLVLRDLSPRSPTLNIHCKSKRQLVLCREGRASHHYILNINYSGNS